jgi:hypothetical protein
MHRMKPLVYLSLAVALSLGSAVSASAQKTSLTAADVVNKNIAARGGLQAWHGVQTLSMSGKMQAGSSQRPMIPLSTGKHSTQKLVEAPASEPASQVELPFKMDMKRGRRLRVELQFQGQTAVQVYDGAHGWKMRPFLNRTDYEPYTSDEVKASSQQSDFDGPLVDYAEKGTKVVLEGMEKVEGRDNYKLNVTLKNGYSFHLWVDAKSFLETKMDGTPRRLDGAYRPVEIYFRDYRPENGLQIPHVLETRVNTIVGLHRNKQEWVSETITIDKVEVNPKLADALFTKPKSENSPEPTKPSQLKGIRSTTVK